MKQNWRELQRTYQALPIITDTTRKILRKNVIESQLRQLENDILLIESNQYFFVYADNVDDNANN